MEVKTKHSKYKDYMTRKQLAEEGLIPTDKGIELWTNQYVSHSATYYDSKKAVKLETITIWRNYYYKDDLTVTEIGAIDQLGNVFFSKPVKPAREWLSQTEHADIWLDVERKNGFTGADILFANSEKTVERQLVAKIKKQKYIKNIISYNVDFNLPDALLDGNYNIIDVMQLFADIIKEPMPPYKEYYGNDEYELVKNDDQKYKWQSLKKCLDYYNIKPDSYKAIDYARSIWQSYQKMKN